MAAKKADKPNLNGARVLGGYVGMDGDPVVGVAVVEAGKVLYEDTVSAPKKAPASWLADLYNEVCEVIKKFEPSAAGVLVHQDTSNRDFSDLHHAEGTVLVAAAQAGLYADAISPAQFRASVPAATDGAKDKLKAHLQSVGLTGKAAADTPQHRAIAAACALISRNS